MGKGDVRTKKGKIRNGSFGIKRKARTTKAVSVITETAKKETTKAKKSAKKTTKDSEE
jgi:ribosomal small subunit protein bTHX